MSFDSLRSLRMTRGGGKRMSFDSLRSLRMTRGGGADGTKGGVESRGMDITWVTERVAVGGGIWTDEKMIEVARQGITHIVNMQIEWDDRPLAKPYGIEVMWCATDDDFEPKPKELFEKGVGFAVKALEDPGAKVYVHCAAGVHRAPMMTLAVLRALGWELEAGMRQVEERRPVVDFAPVYVNSVEEWWESRAGVREKG